MSAQLIKELAPYEALLGYSCSSVDGAVLGDITKSALLNSGMILWQLGRGSSTSIDQSILEIRNATKSTGETDHYKQHQAESLFIAIAAPD